MIEIVMEVDDEFWNIIKQLKEFNGQKEIIHCEDCKYWRNHGKEYPTYCERPDLLDLYADDYGVEMDADDFCSKGEKR